eukprot:7695400-Alexandrium_andersonii.AAC.1
MGRGRSGEQCEEIGSELSHSTACHSMVETSRRGQARSTEARLSPPAATSQRAPTYERSCFRHCDAVMLQ